jgi:hypothetical protein
LKPKLDPSPPFSSHSPPTTPQPTISGADAPEILAAYEAVRSDKDETNWLLISYAAATGSQLTLSKTGTGGLDELAAALDDGQV